MTEPDRFRLLMMGFVDDELSIEERREFLQRCFEDPQLAIELAQYRKLAQITDSLKWREPEDAEYERALERFAFRAPRRLGLSLCLAGAAALAIFGAAWMADAPLPWPVKAAVACLLGGALLFAGSEVWLRRRILRLDRYQGVRR